MKTKTGISGLVPLVRLNLILNNGDGKKIINSTIGYPAIHQSWRSRENHSKTRWQYSYRHNIWIITFGVRLRRLKRSKFKV